MGSRCHLHSSPAPSAHLQIWATGNWYPDNPHRHRPWHSGGYYELAIAAVIRWCPCPRLRHRDTIIFTLYYVNMRDTLTQDPDVTDDLKEQAGCASPCSSAGVVGGNGTELMGILWVVSCAATNSNTAKQITMKHSPSSGRLYREQTCDTQQDEHTARV